MSSSIIPAPRDLPAADRPGLTDRACRRLLLSQLERIQDAQLTVLDRGQRLAFGQANRDADPRCTITVQHPRFYRDAVLGGHLGAAEGYIHGLWDCDDLTGLVRIFARNLSLSDRMDKVSVRLGGALLKIGYYLKRNTLSGSRGNIAAHYDLGNDFFELLLDPTLTYSCAVFESPEASLIDAQVAKLDRLIDKLGLDQGQHLLEIGTGWGALAVRAAQRTGCRVTTTTLSRQQHDHARRLIAENNLGDRVTLLKRDYRELDGQYDKLVSVEMIEAVGHQFYGQFFESCARLLKPTGRGVIQSITIPDGRYESARKCIDFIKKYVFPGSCIPSIGILRQAMARGSGLELTHFEELGPHYAATLRLWAENLSDNRERVVARGYPRELLRLWDFYLAYCEGGFIEHNIGLAQIEVRQPGCTDAPLVVQPVEPMGGTP
ncbi:MAG: cyclopropane-fatty-acyl-phospholipid synthase family protein [Phycisphaeraceae bacterium]|nr:cyclopropane-fatty-acyl-phospholipid synthase family protein [Phycisphaeraceae bacterium]